MMVTEHDGKPMSIEIAAAQTIQFWELLQRAQKLALSTQSTVLAKASGQEFSIVDANATGAACMKAFAELAQHPIQLAASSKPPGSTSRKPGLTHGRATALP